MYDPDEPDYRSVLDDSIFTPTSSTRTDSRTHTSSGISIASERAGGDVLSNMIATIASDFGLTATQAEQINRCFQVCKVH
jgi:hypothetical protein